MATPPSSIRVAVGSRSRRTARAVRTSLPPPAVSAEECGASCGGTANGNYRRIPRPIYSFHRGEPPLACKAQLIELRPHQISPARGGSSLPGSAFSYGFSIALPFARSSTLCTWSEESWGASKCSSPAPSRQLPFCCSQACLRISWHNACAFTVGEPFERWPCWCFGRLSRSSQYK